MTRRVVDNTDSTARDHLANERTFLAWVRTALGLIGLGVLLAKLVQTEAPAAQWAGLALVLFGGIVLLYSLGRYQRVVSHLEKGSFPIAKRGPMALGILAIGVAIGAVVFLLM
ncbi:MAG: YidH family protein [Polyangiales bacterium]